MAKTKVKTKTTSAARAGETKKLTAAQRLEALENIVLQQNSKFEILADEIDKIRNLIASLAKRLNATIKAGEDGGISNDSVNKLILENNAKELKGRVDGLIESGVMTREDDTEIGRRTFVVAREIDEDGTIINPRVQFAVASMPEDFIPKILGKKVGDLIKPEDDLTLSLEITEVYQIAPPQEMENNFEEEEEAVETVEAAPEAKEAKAAE